MTDWSYFDKYEALTEEYLPAMGEGETMATQIVTATCKLVYKWFNDGDVFDNVHSPLTGWANDLSSYANWLARYTGCGDLLDGICECDSDDDYSDLLAELCEYLLQPDYLTAMNRRKKQGSIYNCKGSYEFCDPYEYDEE